MSAHQPYSFFQSVERSFDKAAKFTKWESGVLEQFGKTVGLILRKMRKGLLKIVNTRMCKVDQYLVVTLLRLTRKHLHPQIT